MTSTNKSYKPREIRTHSLKPSGSGVILFHLKSKSYRAVFWLGQDCEFKSRVDHSFWPIRASYSTPRDNSLLIGWEKYRPIESIVIFDTTVKKQFVWIAIKAGKKSSSTIFLNSLGLMNSLIMSININSKVIQRLHSKEKTCNLCLNAHFKHKNCV
jgi:hypothetical protein